MSKDLTDLQLLRELEPVVEPLVNRHMRMKKDWNPHDYIPWSDGKNYYALGGQDWDPEQSQLSDVGRSSSGRSRTSTSGPSVTLTTARPLSLQQSPRFCTTSTPI